MSFSVLALQYARLGEGDKAYELFVQSFRPNQLPPFGVISEGAGGTNPYFVTGAEDFYKLSLMVFVVWKLQIMASSSFSQNCRNIGRS